jgi:hypothetical protein
MSAIEAQASVLLEAQYDMLYHANNTYTSSTGESFSGSGSVDKRFLGLGGRYIFENVGSDLLNVELNGTYYFPAQTQPGNSMHIWESGVGGSLNLGPHRPFIGLLYTKFTDSDSNGLKYSADLGFQLGYRYLFAEKHSLFANLSWRKSKSDNPPSVNDEKTTLSMWAVGYSYQLL